MTGVRPGISRFRGRDRLPGLLEGADGGEFRGLFGFGPAEEVMVLQAHPVFRLVAEIAAELEAMLGRELAAAGEDVVEELRADVDVRGFWPIPVPSIAER